MQRSEETQATAVKLLSAFKSRSLREKLGLADLRYNTGDVIEYDESPTVKRYAYKIGPNQYIDFHTKSPLEASVVAEFIVDPKRSRSSTYAAANSRIGTAVQSMNQNRNKVMIDFETAVRNPSLMKEEHLFTLGVSTISNNGGKKILKNTDIYMLDVFDKLVLGTQEEQLSARGSLSSMSKQVQQGFVDRFNTLIEKNPSFNLGKLASASDLLDKTKMGKIVGAFNDIQKMNADTETHKTITDIGRTVGTQGADTTFHLARLSQVPTILKNEFNVEPGKISSPTMQAFNSAIENKGMEIIYKNEKPGTISIEDIRGKSLLMNNTLFPNLSENMIATYGPEMKHVSHRLRMSDKQTRNFFDRVSKNGISGLFSGGTAADTMDEIYAASIGKPLPQTDTAHTSNIDSARQLRTGELQGIFYNKALKESLISAGNPASVRSRFIALRIRDEAIHTMMETDMLANKNVSGARKLVGNRFSNVVDMNKLELRIRAKMERDTGQRMSGSLLGQAIGTLGGETVPQLLAGAAMFVGINGALSKAAEMFGDTRENSTEGIRHESIMTNIRRLALTEFGSGKLPGMAPQILSVIGNLFKNNINDPTGTIAIVKNGFARIQEAAKSVTKGKSIASLINDPEAIAKFNEDVFSPKGSLNNAIDKLQEHARISDTTTDFLREIVEKGYQTISTWEATRLQSDGKPVFSKVRQSFDEAYSKYIKDKTGKYKAPAIMMGVGAVGAFATMRIRGAYDEAEMYKEMQNKEDKKYRRNKEEYFKNKVREISKAANEGIALGSSERQNNRYKMTDFGSPYNGMLRTLQVASKMVKDTTPEFSEKVYKILPSKLKGDQLLNNNTVPKVAAHLERPAYVPPTSVSQSYKVADNNIIKPNNKYKPNLQQDEIGSVTNTLPRNATVFQPNKSVQVLPDRNISNTRINSVSNTLVPNAIDNVQPGRTIVTEAMHTRPIDINISNPIHIANNPSSTDIAPRNRTIDLLLAKNEEILKSRMSTSRKEVAHGSSSLPFI